MCKIVNFYIYWQVVYNSYKYYYISRARVCVCVSLCVCVFVSVRACLCVSESGVKLLLTDRKVLGSISALPCDFSLIDNYPML